MSQQGVSDYDVRSWAGLMAPAGRPAATVDRLNVKVQKALLVRAVKTRREDMDGEAHGYPMQAVIDS
ncbi:tripartite tricarboxylate transporter substrate-binding protein [Limnohabitans sp. JirII-29]|uniref:tripartite tricarboxylate transporter substrate-binding protein n=1 Tax=Limnohabitans sp. JirII-29 TaxID=1835756 RepID=UPI001E2CB7B4|nr:tripartite tricarboxylate transporter substrate-binding protein [Limnohabitans sp. JirII-29]